VHPLAVNRVKDSTNLMDATSEEIAIVYRRGRTEYATCLHAEVGPVTIHRGRRRSFGGCHKLTK
jgi:hypothetical protein